MPGSTSVMVSENWSFIFSNYIHRHKQRSRSKYIEERFQTQKDQKRKRKSASRRGSMKGGKAAKNTETWKPVITTLLLPPAYSPAQNGARTWQVCTWARMTACRSGCDVSRKLAVSMWPSFWFPDLPPARRSHLMEGRVLLWDEPWSVWVRIQTQCAAESSTL